MKKSIGRMFIKGFIQSFFIVAILLTVGILSYKLTMKFWQAPEEAVIAYQEETVPESIIEARVDDISKNLIFCYKEDTKEITKIVLEIFHCKNHQITYITIPMRTQVSMSDTLYREMILVHPSMPQVLQLSAITNYLDHDTAFDYGAMMIEELLDIKISYYTAIPQEIYDEMFTSKTIATNKDTNNDGSISDDMSALPVECFSKEYIKFISKLKTAEDISSYIEEIYPKLRSNLTVFDKLKYLESYSETPIDNISFELVQGNDTNSAFILDVVLMAQRYNEITKNKVAGSE